MRVLVIGAGALGGLIGARLSENGAEVAFLEANASRARMLNEQGLFLSEGDKGEHRVRVKVVTSAEGLEPADLVFIAVKSYQTAGAVRAAGRVIGPKTWVLSTQNGLGNVETIAALVGAQRVLSGITFHSIQHTGPNRLCYRMGIRPMQMAPIAGELTDELLDIGRFFTAAGLTTEVLANVDHAVWQKLLHNAVVNPVSALSGMSCNELLEDDELQQLMRALTAEIVAVMKAREVPVAEPAEAYQQVVGSLRALGKNRPSMWQDLVRGLLTEIDAINGGVVAEAERLGLEAPLNLAMVRLVHSRERQALRRREKGAKTLADVAASQAARSAEVSPKLPGGALRPSPLDPKGGMPEGRVPLASAPKLKELIHDYYLDLDRAGRDERRRVAWCTGLGPVELVRAMGYTPYFPENHAALIGAGRLASKYLRVASADGFSPFVATEMTCDIGAAIAGESPLATIHGMAGIPRPEVLVYSTNHGQYLLRWFEYYSHRFGVPAHGLHPPAGLDQLDAIDHEASVAQMWRLVERLEKLTGQKLDLDRLGETVELSARASLLWSSILDLGSHLPSPLTYFDTLIHAAPMVLMRGTRQAVTYYELLLAELEARVRDGVAAVPEERLRFYWEGPPLWCGLRRLASFFLDHRIAVVGSSYPSELVLEGLQAGDPIASMARAYAGIYSNRGREFKARFLANESKRFSADAVLWHDARTSPDHSNVRHGLHHRLARDAGVRSLVIEADTHDARLASFDQMERGVLDFVDDLRRHSRDSQVGS